ncbi:MAG: benzoate-CoA ligase family protein [Actinobacteria bacterium]|nr:benzoate-CoA ligase family protein [Actinomycetota bacterium]
MAGTTTSTPRPPFEAGPSFNASAYLVDRHVEAGDGARVALRCDGADTTYAALAALTARVAAAFTALGVRREERVLFLMADTVELAAGILGAMRAGMVAVPVSTMLTAADLGPLLADCRARVVVASADFAEALAAALPASDAVTHLVVTGGARPQVPAGAVLVDWDDALAAGDGAAPGGAPVVAAGDDAGALWLYTSGTTGVPKAAMHRHANIRHVCETYGAQVLGIRRDDRCLSVAKLFFAYGIGNSLFFPLSVGAMAILEPRRPTPATVAERAQADRPTVFYAVPAFFAGMLAADLPADTLDGVRIATSAGEALPAALQQRWTARFGVDILDGLGSTEALHIFLSNAPGDIGPGTSGRPVPGYEVEVRAEDGSRAPVGTPGMLFVSGESIATGYWCRTATTRSVFQGRWLATGDTYVEDADGRFTCLGRSNDMIKAGGIWVSPGEVEARLLEHPDVVEAAVVGGVDHDGLERPVAAVVLRDGGTVTGDDLVAFCREGLAHFKAPRAVLVRDALPRTATGKLQRFKVRALVVEQDPLHARDAAPSAAPVR